jgi:hypothetical protein
MAQNSSIIVDVYSFASAGNKYTGKQQTTIPLPAQAVPAVSPDSAVYCYSKLIYEMPKGMVREAYTAETVQALNTKMTA